MVHRLWEPVARADQEDTDAARLAAFDQMRQMLSWLRLPLVEDAGYGAADPAVGYSGVHDPETPG